MKSSVLYRRRIRAFSGLSIQNLRRTVTKPLRCLNERIRDLFDVGVVLLEVHAVRTRVRDIEEQTGG
jgi:hypothetical protein